MTMMRYDRNKPGLMTSTTTKNYMLIIELIFPWRSTGHAYLPPILDPSFHFSFLLCLGWLLWAEISMETKIKSNWHCMCKCRSFPSKLSCCGHQLWLEGSKFGTRDLEDIIVQLGELSLYLMWSTWCERTNQTFEDVEIYVNRIKLIFLTSLICHNHLLHIITWFCKWLIL